MGLSEIKFKSGDKKYLTTRTLFGYSESLKLIKRLSHPIEMRFFCIPNGWMIARNILNTSKVFLIGFSESTLPHVVRGFLKRIKKMTNTIIKKITEELNKPINALSDRFGKFALLEIYAKENANG
jgi:hypothetical protein